MHSSVHVDHLAGDEARKGGRQEHHRMRDFFGFAEPAHRDCRQLRLPLRIGKLFGNHRRHHIGGRDGICRHPLARHFARNGKSQPDHRRLGDRVGSACSQPAGLCRIGGQVDHAPPARGAHAGKEGLRQKERGIDVDALNPVPFFQRGGCDLGVVQGTRIVDQDVDASHLIKHACRHS